MTTGVVKGLERWGRRAASLLGPLVSAGDGIIPPEPRRILVIRTDSRLGNLVLMEPLLRSLRVRFPEADIEVLASDRFSSILELQGYRVIGVDKRGQILDPSRFIRLIGHLRGRDYDVAIDAAHPHSFSLSGAVSAVLAGASCTISTDAGDSPAWYTETVSEPSLRWHESRALHHLGSLWDRWPEWSPPVLRPPGSFRKRDAVGMHVGASGEKAYPEDRMEELVSLLSGRTMLEMYWGTDDERRKASRLSQRFPVAIMPRLTMEGLLERLAGLRVFISADGGPMHVASALSVPVKALFREANMDRFAPLSEGSEVFFDPEGPDPSIVAEKVLISLGLY
ncbi:MAG: hypothetical protein AVO35_04580 [Candidatus Aegiribacteria sp. MLS_C]|nr:MAG: hypothetical protein AVO35_04580 [Candidatus Aegiribacteria sp. MLS_C]